MKTNNSILIKTTFDEMIARWTVTGYYNSYAVDNMKMTDLGTLRSIELFLSDIERMRTDIFIKRGDSLRNTSHGFKFCTQFHPTVYAKKWFPFKFLFNEILIYMESSSYHFREVSRRFTALFFLFNLNIRELVQDGNEMKIFQPLWVDDPEQKVDPIRLNLFNEKMRKLDDFNQLNDSDIMSINVIINNYKEVFKGSKIINRLDYNFYKKRDNYIEYFLTLLNKYNGLFVFSINFYIKNDYKIFDLPQIKKDFFNTLRSKQEFSILVGYMGTWEFCKHYGYFFRVLFFVPRKKINDYNELFDNLIHVWETFGYSKKEMRDQPTYEAELNNISESNINLRTPYSVIGKKNQTLISAFIDSVINYTTLCEKYFFPAELQMFIFEHMLDNKKEKAPDGKFIIDSLKSGFSRSFRGHIKN
ncbi:MULTISPECIES: hypothetical protein [Acinetobacter]|uniref:hypothetical protein n=1 Tax=Acinetobacter TaxID=469 RepID=UPI0015D296C6|nr:MULTISPECIES: hypothetical protein [Acinetobacter]QSQ94316.1 hypothetical protein J0W32_05570 [Acinetobacter indicus]